jgi:PAS domain S-box-containing protein
MSMNSRAKQSLGAWLVLCFAVPATVLVSFQIKQSIDKDAARQFALICDQVTLKIQERLTAYLPVLRGSTALFLGHDTVPREEWRAYVDSLRQGGGVPVVQEIGFVQAIAPDRLAGRIADMRRQGVSEYTVRPPGDRSLYAPVVYVEPSRERQLHAVGFDMFSDPVRRVAMEQARDSGKAVLSGKVELPTESGPETQPGALLYIPVYRHGMPWQTVGQRRRALLGWVFSPCRMVDLMDGILGDWGHRGATNVDLHLFDGLQATAAARLFDSDSGEHEIPSPFRQQRAIDFNGRQWLLVFDPVRTKNSVSYAVAWTALIGGLALSGLLFGLLRAESNTRANAVRIANILTKEIANSEQLLRDSEYRWKFAVEGAGDGLWDWKVTESTVFYSGRWKEMLGFAEDEIGSALDEWEKRLYPDDRAATLAALQAYLDGKAPAYVCEHRLRCKDGSYRWILARGMVVSRNWDGKPLRMIGTITDISDRKRAEEALRQREHYQRALLDNFPFVLWLKDEQSRFLAVNQAFAASFGWPSADSLIGKSDFDITSPDLAEGYLADDRAVLTSGSSKQVEELVETGGQRRWFETYKSPVTVDGRVIGTVGFMREITERKQNETALVAARQAAEKANHAKSHFLAAASHDLRQPLSALSLYVGVLKNTISPENSELLGNIQDCIDSLSELLTDLLDVSKLDAGVVTPCVSSFAIDDLLHALVSIHSAEAELKGLRLRRRNSGAIARTDPVLLRRILGNLVANAVRYTERGGVLIACRRHQGKLWVEVWDTGIGIAEDQTDIVFEEFRQLGDNSRNRGSGLGLAIVAKIAGLLGLQIRLRSRPGRGSMFAVELPPGLPSVLADIGAPAPAARPLRIALAEDNVDVLRALVLALESAGHEVLASSSGGELIRRLGDLAPDIVVSDYRLAGTEKGFDVIVAVRKVFGEALPAVLITGDTDPALIRSMADRGIAILYKPLRSESLLAFIQEATERKLS